MAKYEIITPKSVNAAYSLTGSILVGGPPPIGMLSNSDGMLTGWWRLNKDVSASGDLPPLSAFKVVPYDFSWSASNKDLFRRKWNNILIGE